MKKVVATLAILASVGFFASAQASQNNCASQRANIEGQIQNAQRQGNSQQLSRLQSQLAQLNATCTASNNNNNNNSDQAQAQKKINDLQKQIAAKQKEIGQIQKELNDAQAKGKASKIAKYEKKIQGKQDDIRELQQKIDQVRAGL
ncbi:DUF1090 family protein [Scandinavium sp. NPDC088450]|uniref:DUF1090 family protein n=1 Tax=Scandinavium sp. NPDC088450 TaxID=3364514 RepID=UPI00384C484E